MVTQSVEQLNRYLRQYCKWLDSSCRDLECSQQVKCKVKKNTNNIKFHTQTYLAIAQ